MLRRSKRSLDHSLIKSPTSDFCVMRGRSGFCISSSSPAPLFRLLYLQNSTAWDCSSYEPQWPSENLQPGNTAVQQDLTRHPLSRRTLTVTWGRSTFMGSCCQDSEGLEKSTDWLSFSIMQVFYKFIKHLLKNKIQIFNLLSSNSPKHL